MRGGCRSRPQWHGAPGVGVASSSATPTGRRRRPSRCRCDTTRRSCSIPIPSSTGSRGSPRPISRSITSGPGCSSASRPTAGGSSSTASGGSRATRGRTCASRCRGRRTVSPTRRSGVHGASTPTISPSTPSSAGSWPSSVGAAASTAFRRRDRTSSISSSTSTSPIRRRRRATRSRRARARRRRPSRPGQESRSEPAHSQHAIGSCGPGCAVSRAEVLGERQPLNARRGSAGVDKKALPNAPRSAYAGDTAMWTDPPPTIRVGPAVALALAILPAAPAHAACNLIPSASLTYRSSLGATNKPYAAPGDFVEIEVRPALCDVVSPGLRALGTDHDVTVVFTPPGNGQRRVVLLTADCAAAAAKRTACEAAEGVGTGNVACVDTAAGLARVERNNVPHLSFRFPGTDALFGPPGDRRTLTGPVTIAVTAATNPALPCDLASRPCSAEAGLIACIDDLYQADGTCAPNPHPTFSHFTALPVPNDYQADCFADAPPCTAVAAETRGAVDTAGNLLLPVNWQGVLVRQANVPVPRLLRGTVKSPLRFPNPPRVSLGSFTPEGAPLPPIFEPQADPSTVDPDVITLFGSADASYTILRIARGLGSCSGGPNAGAPCVDSRDCGGSTCAPVCVGGTVPPGTACVKDGDCGNGGRCAALFADFRPLVSAGGPLVLPRQLAGICQLAPHQACSTNGQCAGLGNACVTYAFEARTPVPLDSLTTGTPDVFAFTVSEAVALTDLNGDGEPTDLVQTMQDRTTGRPIPIGAGAAPARAVTALSEPPFSFPALATEGDVVAFLEPEGLQGTVAAPLDENSDGDTVDTILRVFRRDPGGLSATEVTAGLIPPLAAEAALEVNGQSLVVSGGRVFFRVAEADAVPATTVRVSVSDTGAEANNASNIKFYSQALSANGRFVVFGSLATNLVPGASPTGHVYVHDRDLDGNGVFDEPGAGKTTTEQADVPTGGTPQPDYGGEEQTISADGRTVAFVSHATNLAGTIVFACPNSINSPGASCINVFVHDRVSNV